nr:hypothetical protein [Tanacetum cinerariifolium]
LKLVLLMDFKKLMLVEVNAAEELLLLKEKNVIEIGATLPKTQVVEDVTTVMPITTAKEKAQGRLETQRNLLKQQYENFIASSLKMLDQTFDMLQKLVSQLELLDENLSQKDINQKLLRSLSPEWNTHVVVWRNKADLDTMSMDDLYNKIKMYELEVKGMYSSSSSTRNMAFVSSSNNNSNSTNRTVNTAQAVNTTHGVSTANTQVNAAYSTNIDNLSDAVICAFFSSQPNRRKLTVNGNESISFDKSKVECYICHKKGHFTKECRALRYQDNKNKESSRRSVPVETTNSSALVLCDGLGSYDWSDQAKEGPIYALMAYSSSTFDSKGNPQMDLQDQGVIDSRCSRHMTENMSYLTDYEEIDEGYVAFRGNPKGEKITRKDHFGKFNGKADEGFFVGYSLNSKAFSGPGWLFDIDVLKKIINYEPIVAGTQSNGFTGPKSSHDDGFKTSSDDGKKVDEDTRKESESNTTHLGVVFDHLLLPFCVICFIDVFWPCDGSIDDLEVFGLRLEVELGTVSRRYDLFTEEGQIWSGCWETCFSPDNELPFDPNMPDLEDVSTFNFSSDHEDDDAMADMNNLDTTIQVSPTPTIRIHKDHPLDQVIGDLQSATQIRRMTKNLEEHGFISTIQQRKTHKDLQNCLFACFLSQEEPKKVFRNKKDERGIVIRNKARLVAQGCTQEEGVEYDKVFTPVARIKAIRLFLAYASFKDFMVYQIDVKSAFLYRKIKEEVYLCQLPGFEDPDFPDIVYKVEKALYGLHQAPTAWSMIGSLMYLTSSRPEIMFAVCACARYQVNLKVSHLHAVKKIFRKPKRKDTQVPQPSDPTNIVADEAVYKERGDKLVRADTTASSLEAEQDSGGGLGCQKTMDHYLNQFPKELTH